MRTRFGITLLEVLVVLAIISILAGIIYPTFARARKQGDVARCMGNLHQAYLAVLQYRADYKEYWMWMPDSARQASAK